jgi:hypothetical protein
MMMRNRPEGQPPVRMPRKAVRRRASWEGTRAPRHQLQGAQTVVPRRLLATGPVVVGTIGPVPWATSSTVSWPKGVPADDLGSTAVA